MYLSNGNTYIPGEGAQRTAQLREGNLPPDVLAHYIEEAHQSIDRYGRVPGATMDLFVADLIDHNIA